MNPRNCDRIRELLCRLEELDRDEPAPHTASIRSIARDAIVDELARLTRDTWLRVSRRGDGLEAVSMSG